MEQVQEVMQSRWRGQQLLPDCMMQGDGGVGERITKPLHLIFEIGQGALQQLNVFAIFHELFLTIVPEAVMEI